MKTKEDFYSWIEETLPIIVKHWIIDGKQLKQCGTVSSAIAAKANEDGFNAIVVSEPGHFVANIEVDEGYFRVDATHLQFNFKHGGCLRDYDKDDEEYIKMKELFQELKKDPMKAVDISFINENIKNEGVGYDKDSLLESFKHALTQRDLARDNPEKYKKWVDKGIASDVWIESYQDNSFRKIVLGTMLQEDPKSAGKHISDIVKYLLNRMPFDKKPFAIQKIKKKILELDVNEMGGKKSPMTASMGNSITLIKTILNGKSPSYIKSVLEQLVKNL